jgi:hypothetical protein
MAEVFVTDTYLSRDFCRRSSLGHCIQTHFDVAFLKDQLICGRASPLSHPESYSHSIVAGGLEEMSYTTRLTPGTSLTIRLEMRARRS